MEDLNKSQVVLLTLFVSFVTSIATGIVTVTLMDQAPPAVTQTIDRVVEKTVQTVVPAETQKTTVVKEVEVSQQDLIVESVAANKKSIVTIDLTDTSIEETLRTATHLGVVVSSGGLIATTAPIPAETDSVDISYDSKTFAATVLANDTENDGNRIMLLQATTTPYRQGTTTPDTQIFVPATFALPEDLNVGQSVVGLDTRSSDEIRTGVISGFEHEEIAVGDTGTTTEFIARINTDISTASPLNDGALILLLDGKVAGFADIADQETIGAVPGYFVGTNMQKLGIALESEEAEEQSRLQKIGEALLQFTGASDTKTDEKSANAE